MDNGLRIPKIGVNSIGIEPVRTYIINAPKIKKKSRTRRLLTKNATNKKASPAPERSEGTTISAITLPAPGLFDSIS